MQRSPCLVCNRFLWLSVSLRLSWASSLLRRFNACISGSLFFHSNLYCYVRIKLPIIFEMPRVKIVITWAVATTAYNLCSLCSGHFKSTVGASCGNWFAETFHRCSFSFFFLSRTHVRMRHSSSMCTVIAANGSFRRLWTPCRSVYWCFHDMFSSLRSFVCRVSLDKSTEVLVACIVLICFSFRLVICTI